MKTLPILLLGLVLLGCKKQTDLTDLRRELIATQLAVEGLDLKHGLWQAPEFHRQVEQLTIAARLHEHDLTPEQRRKVDLAINQVNLTISAGLLYTRDGTPTLKKIAEFDLDTAKDFLKSAGHALEPTP